MPQLKESNACQTKKYYIIVVRSFLVELNRDPKVQKMTSRVETKRNHKSITPSIEEKKF